jgi:hypothetical protein
MLPHGCRPYEGLDASPDAGEDAGTALDAGSDALLDAGCNELYTGPPPSSCKALLERAPVLRGCDGIYTIDPDGPESLPPIPVFCDFTLDDGGWTLVGRSAEDAGTPSPFGWTSATGSVTDDSKPYSLNVAAAFALFTFTEVLVANRERTLAYKFTVPNHFVTSYTNAAVQVQQLTMVRGNDCDANAPPQMLGYAGYTSKEDGFFLSKDQDSTFYGLGPHGFSLDEATCARSGELHGQQGAIFVR